MTITANSQDKYAFLFSGPTAVGRFIQDLEKVFQILTQSCNYPASNITVVLGSSAAVPSVPGATIVTITNAADLEAALTSFAGLASGPASVAGLAKTALLYFTGGGISEVSVSKLVIDGGPGSNHVTPTWLTTRLNAFSNCHVNVVMQQDFAGGFASALTSSTLTQWSFTSACTATQQSYGVNTTGSFFTSGWVKGFKLETLPAGTLNAGQYADQLGTGGEGTNRLIAVAEAKEFGKQIQDWQGFGLLSTPGYSEFGGPQYLGLPAFLIRDGSPAWWESPDIYLTHPNHAVPDGDLYIPDLLGAVAPFNNTINVDVRNVGTHPVRAYSLGLELFKSGAGATNQQQTQCDQIPVSGILLPIDLADIGTATDHKDTYAWNTAFYIGTTHECITAEAKLLCGDVDFNWSIVARDFEGQRNTDEMPMAPLQRIDLPIRNLQGFVAHRYGILNRFDTPRQFILAFPKAYQRYRDLLELTWFVMPDNPQGEMMPLEVVDGPVPYIPFLLKGGENRDLLVRVSLKPKLDPGVEVKLPFEILVEGDWRQDDIRVNALVQRQNYAAIAGFTLLIRQASATLQGMVLNQEHKPIARATVFMQTINDQQGATIPTDANGEYTFPEINPGVYRIWAEADDWRSSEQMVVLVSDQKEGLDLILTERSSASGKRIKVILDMIRISNDNDPRLKGKGELTLTAIVVPDNDEARKQVLRLPARGVYKVSNTQGKNDLQLDTTLFDGLVKNRSFSMTLSGKEIDRFDPNDPLGHYHRVFSGDPEQWYGQYAPSNEYLHQAEVDGWMLWYRIVPG